MSLKQKINCVVLAFCLSIITLGTTYAQDPAAATKVTRGYLNLSQGVTSDEKITDLPVSPQFEGDYKKITKLFLDPETKTLRFTPTQLGNGTLVILDAHGKKFREYYITVEKSRLNKVAREIKALLGEIEGIDIKIINGKVVVDGEILLPRDMNRIYSVVSQYPELASSIVTLSPLAQKKIAELIEKDINNPEITCRSVNGKFILEGYASNDKEKDKAEVIAKTYVPDVVVEAAEAGGLIKKQTALAVINLLNVKPAEAAPPKKIIQLVVHYVELNKDYEKGFKFQWTPTLDDGTNINFSSSSREPGGVISSITGTVSNLLPKLNWAKAHGHARILQSSSVIVQDGSAGKIKSVTQIPYQSVGPQGQPITNQTEAGIITNITPKIINPQSDSVDLDISFEVSAMVGMSGTAPLISRNTIQTNLTVRSAQSAAIGGLVSNSSGTDYNKIPKTTTGTDPLISLYTSKAFRRNQSQFVVFVTPVIKSSASAGSEKIKSKFKLKD